MANKKISELTPKGTQIQDDDLFMVSDYNGATYDTKSVTGANIRPFKTIMFNISQTGTSAPTKNYSYEDEVTQTFTFGYTSSGQYTLTSSSALFTSNKTFLFISSGVAPTDEIGVIRDSTTQLTIFSHVNDALDKANLEIKIIK
ncbi:hypothetical protein UFOVP207_10 [uncultured Caudovirales phage]|uniref:Uncharacterized protein n=1 Tax=uncultured Caudovirales phage TaxID=2100421 RepID=A0A6J7WHY4_9CAUD|nr:hypothetical protein UFOVP207_10 [uncultured Caudovirales phage]